MIGRPSASDGAWAAATLGVSVAASPVHWRISAFALGLAAVAGWCRRWPSFAAAVLAMGAAPLWLSAGAQGRFATPLVATVATALLILARPTLPSALPWVIAALGGLEAGKQALSGGALAGATALALPLLVGGLTIAGVAAGARACPWTCLALGLGGLWNGALALDAATTPPTDPAAARCAVDLGVAFVHLDALSADPALGLSALGADPRWGALAERLLPQTGPQPLLATGWEPESTALGRRDRLAVATLLDAGGEGGRALRLLRHAGDGPGVAWTRDLLSRSQGLSVESDAEAPPGVPHLPGAVTLSWEFYQNGVQTLDFQADTPLRAVSLEVLGVAYRGVPTLLVAVDGRPPVRITAPEGAGTVRIDGQTLARGPHRLRVRFDNDLVGADGDRNVNVRALVAD